ncbi:TPA: AAA family ATPase [Salmonella enterica]|uniref:ParA family protein n=1 Tax=Salmonella enterica TaxID=28901 RepID=UPI0009AF6436|nr:AAA family ATPase [Salmonella enterica]HBD1844135.1 AAA family ATPase [Salmonella enterica]
MKILPVISPKGGEGKSTSAANCAGMCADAGLRSLLIDGDYSQPTASSIFPLEYEAPAGLHELLMQTVSDPSQTISRTTIPNLDVIISNDPDEMLPTAMLHAPDGRLRLRNVLQHPAFSHYDVVIVDSKGASGVMVELALLSATERVMGVVKPILPDIREFLRGSLRMLERLLPFENYGICLPEISILVNCIENTVLDRASLAELTAIVTEKRYDTSLLGGRDIYRLLNTRIDSLDIYKLGHVKAQPVHRLEYKTDRKSPAAAVTMHSLVCELFPEWKERFDAVLEMGRAS